MEIIKKKIEEFPFGPLLFEDAIRIRLYTYNLICYEIMETNSATNLWQKSTRIQGLLKGILTMIYDKFDCNMDCYHLLTPFVYNTLINIIYRVKFNIIDNTNIIMPLLNGEENDYDEIMAEFKSNFEQIDVDDFDKSLMMTNAADLFHLIVMASDGYVMTS